MIPQALKLNPAFFKTVYTDLLNAKKTRTSVQAALDAVDALRGRARADAVRAGASIICARPARRGRAREIEGHFKRNFDVSGVTTACEYLADQGLIGKASTPVRLTKRSNVDVQELAFFYLERPIAMASVTVDRHGADDEDVRQGRGAHDDRRAGRARPQPEEHLARDPARQPHRRHRPLGLGQVEPGVRHHLRRGAAALHGVALELSPSGSSRR